MFTIRVVVAKRQSPYRDMLVRLIEDVPEFRMVAVSEDEDELIHDVTRMRPELIVAEIGTPFIGGLETIRKCMQIQPEVEFILLSEHEHFAVDAFRVHAIDYMLLPLEENRLIDALHRAKQMIECKRDHLGRKKLLPIQYKHTYYFIPLEDILFIEKVDRKCVIHTREQLFSTYDSLGRLMQNLNSRFYQTHRSYIVQLASIHSIMTCGNTFLAYFKNYEHPAHISKQKIHDVLLLAGADFEKNE